MIKIYNKLTFLFAISNRCVTLLYHFYPYLFIIFLLYANLIHFYIYPSNSNMLTFIYLTLLYVNPLYFFILKYFTTITSLIQFISIIFMYSVEIKLLILNFYH